MLLLNKANLRVAQFASKEESRYSLHAIHVSDEGTTATDGFRRVRVSLPKDADPKNYPTVPNFPAGNGKTEGLIPLSLVAKLENNCPTKQTIPILNHVGVSFDETNVNTVSTDLETASVLTQRKITGSFPNIKAAIPTKEPLFEITLDAQLLAEVAKGAAEFMKEERNKPLRLRFYSKDESVRMDAKPQQGQEWLAVLMPVRS